MVKQVYVNVRAIQIILLFIVFSHGAYSQQTDTIILSQNWKFRQVGKIHWLPAIVPGTVHTDLFNNGLIEDPYYRLNEHYLQWIDKADWEYSTEIEVTHENLAKRNIDLTFEGIDTYADVFLNDSLILQSDNMFRSWNVPVRGILKAGKNKLHIVLKSPIREGLKLLEANLYPLPASNDQSSNGDLGNKAVSIFTRKAGYHYGWDWGPRLVTSGIWRPVKLIAWNDISIENIHLMQKEVTPKKASIDGKLTLHSSISKEVNIRVLIDGKLLKNFTLLLKEGVHQYAIPFEIKEPELWWTNGLGSQKLYVVDLQVFDNQDFLTSKNVKIGLRTLKLVQKPDVDGQGESFYFELNGIPVFAKGANYIPNDLFLPRVTHEDYEEIIKSAADANMNMLRVWGGGVYEDDYFYDLCDQYGILVWQDFMFACSMYPGGQNFFTNVRNEAIDNIIRLRNHPCIALWCGNNEIEVAWAEYNEKSGWGWKEQYTKEQRKEIWANYDTVFHQILPHAVEEFSGGAEYWHSSPSAGMGSLSTYTSTSGDMHYWGVWHGQHPFTDFKKYRARFMSEYGFQSFPEFQSVEKYTIPGDWNIESDVMSSHQRSGIGNLRIRQYMEDTYLLPTDFKQFLYVGQLLQAQAITTAIESHRSDMPYCMGSLYWQINDCWPVASWSGIDYYGRWKALHYAVKEAFKTDIVLLEEVDGVITVKVVTDRLSDYQATLRIRLFDFNGKMVWNNSEEISVKGNCSGNYGNYNIAEILTKIDKTIHLLYVELIEDGKLIDEGINYFAKPKDMNLSDPLMKIEVEEKEDLFELSISGTSLIKNLNLVTTASDSRFSDNYFDVIPGMVKTITYPKRGLEREQFVKSLETLHLFQTMK